MVYQHTDNIPVEKNKFKYRKCVSRINRKEADATETIYDKKKWQWPIAKAAILEHFKLFMKEADKSDTHFSFYIINDYNDGTHGEVLKGVDAISMTFGGRPWNVGLKFFENGKWVGGSVGYESGGAVHFSLDNLGGVTAWVYLPITEGPKPRATKGPAAKPYSKKLTSKQKRRLNQQFIFAKKALPVYKVVKTEKACVVLLHKFNSPFSISHRTIRRAITTGVNIAWEFSYTGKISFFRKLKMNAGQLIRRAWDITIQHYPAIIVTALGTLIAAVIWDSYNPGP